MPSKDSKAESPPEKQVTCPYCGSKFEDETVLSKHMDRIHIGSGLLEGDRTRW